MSTDCYLVEEGLKEKARWTGHCGSLTLAILEGQQTERIDRYLCLLRAGRRTSRWAQNKPLGGSTFSLGRDRGVRTNPFWSFFSTPGGVQIFPPPSAPLGPALRSLKFASSSSGRLAGRADSLAPVLPNTHPASHPRPRQLPQTPLPLAHLPFRQASAPMEFCSRGACALARSRAPPRRRRCSDWTTPVYVYCHGCHFVPLPLSLRPFQKHFLQLLPLP